MNEQKLLTGLNEARALYLLKSLPIKVDFYHEDDNSWSCWCSSGIETYGEGDTLDECKHDLAVTLKEMADIYITSLSRELAQDPQLALYVIKCMLSTEEELISCLTGEI